MSFLASVCKLSLVIWLQNIDSDSIQVLLTPVRILGQCRSLQEIAGHQNEMICFTIFSRSQFRRGIVFIFARDQGRTESHGKEMPEVTGSEERRGSKLCGAMNGRRGTEMSILKTLKG